MRKGLVDSQDTSVDIPRLVSSPFSYSCEVLPAEAEDILEASMGAAKAMSQPYGTYVTVSSLFR
jgi:hypothetical protein